MTLFRTLLKIELADLQNQKYNLITKMSELQPRVKSAKVSDDIYACFDMGMLDIH